MNITIKHLIETLRKAAASPENHAPDQVNFFSNIRENSVLVNCGTACCIAGDLILQEWMMNDEPEEELTELINLRGVDPDYWVSDALGLSDLESTLAFDSNTHYELHLLLADTLDSGLRLSTERRLRFGFESSYTEFTYAMLNNDILDLEELKAWIRSISNP
jgi:hypothetical protein